MSLEISESLSTELCLLLVNAFDLVTSGCNKENRKVSGGGGAVIFVTIRIQHDTLAIVCVHASLSANTKTV